MRLTAIILAASLMLASCGSGNTGSSAGSNPLDTASTAAQKDADAFVALAKGSESSGQVPRQTDATAGPLLNAVFNTSALPATPPPFSDLEALNNWLLAVVKVGQTYLLAGTGATTVAQVTAANSDQINRNVSTYAPEFGRYMDAELAIMGLEAATVSANPDQFGSPAAADGMTKIRNGINQTISSVITTISADGPDDVWREARASALTAMAPRAAALLTPDQRQGLQTQALQAASATNDAALKAEFTQLAATMAAGK